jgi:chorismate mutase
VSTPTDDPVIKQFRDQISDNDLKIIDLINKRLSLVDKLWRYKAEHGVDMYAPDREEWMLTFLSRPSGSAKAERRVARGGRRGSGGGDDGDGDGDQCPARTDTPRREFRSTSVRLAVRLDVLLASETPRSRRRKLLSTRHPLSTPSGRIRATLRERPTASTTATTSATSL